MVGKKRERKKNNSAYRKWREGKHYMHRRGHPRQITQWQREDAYRYTLMIHERRENSVKDRQKKCKINSDRTRDIIKCDSITENSTEDYGKRVKRS